MSWFSLEPADIICAMCTIKTNDPGDSNLCKSCDILRLMDWYPTTWVKGYAPLCKQASAIRTEFATNRISLEQFICYRDRLLDKYNALKAVENKQEHVKNMKLLNKLGGC